MKQKDCWPRFPEDVRAKSRNRNNAQPPRFFLTTVTGLRFSAAPFSLF